MENDLDMTLAAIAEPTRRQIVDLLVEGPLPSGRIANKLGLSPPTTSRHLRVLRKAGVVHDLRVESDARVTMYELVPDALLLVGQWVSHMQRHWSQQLEAFRQHAEAARPLESGNEDES
jgi:DNA-binding transcriptional ArsR family regulator